MLPAHLIVHYNRSRSRNRNLWGRQCVSSWWPLACFGYLHELRSFVWFVFKCLNDGVCDCSGSLEPESSYHDRDWIMELPMEADILTFTGILTPEDASVASCFPFDITISISWFPLPCLHYTPLYHRGRETPCWFRAVTLVTLEI